MVPSTNESHGASSGLLFITGTSLEDFKSRKTMTKVRKKAMGSYLKEKRPSKELQRRPREDSTASRSSVESDHQNVVSNNEAMGLFNEGNTSRRSSRDKSPQLRRKTSPELHLSRRPMKAMNMVLDSAPIVFPMRTGVALPYDQVSPGPFQSIGKPLDPFRTMFQSSHPRVSVEELKWHCSRHFGTRAMGKYWIPSLVKAPHTFLSTLCIASTHCDAINERPVESVQSLALRQEVMHLISQNLLNPQARGDDFNIVALTQLIASETIVGGETALIFHEAGVEAMVKQRGGIHMLGANGRIASTLSWVSLQSAILQEKKPRDIYFDYCASARTKNYPNTATVPESPLYCPRGEFESIKRSTNCTSQTIDLLKDIRMMMDLLLHETRSSRQNFTSLKNLHKKITTQYPPLAELQKDGALDLKDWRYEAIRIAAVLTATAIAQRIPLSEAIKAAAENERITPPEMLPSNWTSTDATSSTYPTRSDSPVANYPPSAAWVTASSPEFHFYNPFTFNPTPLPLTVPTSSIPESPFLPTPQPTTRDNATTLLANLKRAIQHSNTSECWGDMAGVFLWISLTVSAASRLSEDKVLSKWFRAQAMRVSIVLCFEHPEAIHSSMLRMCELVDSFRYAESGSSPISTRKESSENVAKRRKL